MDSILLFASNALLSALSISNLGLISSMVGFLHDQHDHVGTYQIDWPGNTVQLPVEPKHLWVDQGHTSNGVAGYGFFLGLFGMFVAWRIRRREIHVRKPSKTLLALAILQFLAIWFTLSAIIFVFLVTNQTQGQHISPGLARSFEKYPEHWWTPETWFKAVLDLPLANQHQRNKISDRVTNMVAWRWILIPLFLIDVGCFAITVWVMVKQRKKRTQTELTVEK